MRSITVAHISTLIAVSTIVVACAFSTDNRIQALSYLPALLAFYNVSHLTRAFLGWKDARRAQA